VTVEGEGIKIWGRRGGGCWRIDDGRRGTGEYVL
jgi:hypothetical protein